jgi:uncharacterized membrane protein
MQQFSTHRPSNTPLLLAAAGIGAMLAYALSSPQRRAALAAAGESALQTGARLATVSADRLQDWLPRQVSDEAGDFRAAARSAPERARSAAADAVHEAADRASDLMHETLSRVRARRSTDRRVAPELARDMRRATDAAIDDSRAHHATGRGVMVAAAAIGAGLYAMQRYGASDRVREKLGVDESGTIVHEKTLFIHAPVEQVFDTWANYENFPRFMSNVRSVEPLAGGRSHWKVRGPAGVSVEFDSIAHMQRPNELRWQSEADSSVRNEGRVTLVPEGNGTRATVRLSYRPPVGALGQAVASLFGADPKLEFEEDLNRMKEFIEGQRMGAPQSA